MPAHIVCVSCDAEHRFSKQPRASLELRAGFGVVGDAHAGLTVQHRSRVARDPGQPNLRQVHLIHAELYAELAQQGFVLEHGQLGENLTTQGLNLLALPRGSRLYLGAQAVIEVTGLRNPCAQLDSFRPGLTAAVLDRGEDGQLIRKAGVMAIVLRDGQVRPGDAIAIEWPPKREPLLPV